MAPEGGRERVESKAYLHSVKNEQQPTQASLKSRRSETYSVGNPFDDPKRCLQAINSSCKCVV